MRPISKPGDPDWRRRALAGNALAARAIKPSIEVLERSGALSLFLERCCEGRTGRLVFRPWPRHCGQECRRIGAADRARARVGDRAGRRGAPRMGGEMPTSLCRRAWRRAPARPALRPCWCGRKIPGRQVGSSLAAANIDPRILALRHVRELEREDRIVSFRLTIPDRPGVLGQIATRFGELCANILGMSITAAVSRRAGQGLPPRRHGRDTRQGACRGDFAGAEATASSRCASTPRTAMDYRPCPGRSAAAQTTLRWCAADPGRSKARCSWRSRISGAPIRAIARQRRA